MTEQTHIFDSVENTAILKKRKSHKRWMRVGQITAVILSTLLIISTSPAMRLTTIDAFIIAFGFLLLAILSFWKPFVFLLILSIISGGFQLVFLGFIVFLWDEVVAEGKDSGTVMFNIVYFLLNFLVIVGTIAAKKYNQLNKQKER